MFQLELISELSCKFNPHYWNTAISFFKFYLNRCYISISWNYLSLHLFKVQTLLNKIMSFRKMDEHLGKVLGDSAYRYLGHSAYSSNSQLHHQQEYLNQSGNIASRKNWEKSYQDTTDKRQFYKCRSNIENDCRKNKTYASGPLKYKMKIVIKFSCLPRSIVFERAPVCLFRWNAEIKESTSLYSKFQPKRYTKVKVVKMSKHILSNLPNAMLSNLCKHSISKEIIA